MFQQNFEGRNFKYFNLKDYYMLMNFNNDQQNVQFYAYYFWGVTE